MTKYGLLIAFLFQSGLLAATSAVADTAEQRLNQFFKQVQSMSADFTQSIISESQPEIQKSQGILKMQRPGKFRWDYSSPYEQHIVADGRKLWVYDVEMEQVIVKSLDLALGNTPAVLLSGNVDITEKFQVTEISSSEDDNKGLFWMQLVPKQEEAGFEKLLLGFSGPNLHTMELKDAFGQVTRITFANLKQNPEIDSSVFQFEIPPGVDVIDEGENAGQ